MLLCQTFGCNREIAPWHQHCCRLCYEAHAHGHITDEHTPECNLRLAIAEDPVVEKWAAIYEQLGRLGPAFRESWRHLQHSFYATDVGILSRENWDRICAQLRVIRDLDYDWLVVFGCPGLEVNLKTGELNNPTFHPGFKVEFPKEAKA